MCCSPATGFGTTAVMTGLSTRAARLAARGSRGVDGIDAQATAPYLDAVAAYALRQPARFHVPGHKGGPGADPDLRGLLGSLTLMADIPRDIDGVDLGASPTPYEQAEQLAADAYGAGRSWFLTNGASQGNHALTLAYAAAGTTVVTERNAHASVLDGLVMSGGELVDVVPAYDSRLGIPTVVGAGQLDACLRAHPHASAVFVTSPNYFGMTADVAACAEVVHRHGAELIVDQSWGPHFGFHPDVPASALQLGADALLTSTHKLAGSLTQSAMVHVARDRHASEAALERAVRLVRSTSPSSLLLMSLDAARRQLSTSGNALLTTTLSTAARLREAIDAVAGCTVAEFDGLEDVVAVDPLKLFVDVRATGLSGYAAARLRTDHDVHLELATEAGFLLLLGIGEPPAHADRLAHALRAVVQQARAGGARTSSPDPIPPPPVGARLLTPREAFLSPTRRVPVDAAVGEISAELVAGYPPGIPTLVPGEVVSAEALAHLATLRASGVRLHGPGDASLRTLLVADRSPG